MGCAFTDADPVPIASQAAIAAAACDDDYKRSAVRSWEIAALAERGHGERAMKALREAVDIARRVQPSDSRSEALLLLMQAAFMISRETAESVGAQLTQGCSDSDPWRCKRAVKHASQMMDGTLEPRKFFW